MLDQVPSEVWYTILGWFLATIGTAILKALYQKWDLRQWERTVLNRVTVFAYDEDRRDIYRVIGDAERRVDRYELVLHIDSDPQKYQTCMSHIARHFNRSPAHLGHTRRHGQEVTYRKNLEAYVVKPYKSFQEFPANFHQMSREALVKAYENRTA